MVVGGGWLGSIAVVIVPTKSMCEEVVEVVQKVKQPYEVLFPITRAHKVAKHRWIQKIKIIKNL